MRLDEFLACDAGAVEKKGAGQTSGRGAWRWERRALGVGCSASALTTGRRTRATGLPDAQHGSGGRALACGACWNAPSGDLGSAMGRRAWRRRACRWRLGLGAVLGLGRAGLRKRASGRGRRRLGRGRPAGLVYFPFSICFHFPYSVSFLSV
jgi:hypothetical protein